MTTKTYEIECPSCEHVMTLDLHDNAYTKCDNKSCGQQMHVEIVARADAIAPLTNWDLEEHPEDFNDECHCESCREYGST